MRAQDNPNPEQMKKAYEAAQEQLKAAQERKNQLAAENETLKANVAELQKQLDCGQRPDGGHEARGRRARGEVLHPPLALHGLAELS